MPRVLVYEYLTALDIGRDPASPQHSLYREGRAMRDAVLADLRQLPAVSVASGGGYDSENEAATFRHLARGYEWVVLIAPEFDFILETRAGWVREAGSRLLGPGPDALAATRDKLALYHRWQAHAVLTPETDLTCDWCPSEFPVVIKPVDGAGSVATYLCADAASFRANYELACRESPGDPMAQRFVSGRPASVAFLIGPDRTIPLLPTFQRLSDDGRFRYLGGELPIRPDLADRAVRLGRRAVECVPGLSGYVGVDLVLGDAADGSRDYAIEINPRLTTSYVGLRVLADFNIAEVMLNLATGQPVPAIRWKPGRVRFDPDGTFSYDPTPGAGYG